MMNITCDVCHVGHMVQRKGRSGPFWGCSNYPNCTATMAERQHRRATGDYDIEEDFIRTEGSWKDDWPEGY